MPACIREEQCKKDAARTQRQVQPICRTSNEHFKHFEQRTVLVQRTLRTQVHPTDHTLVQRRNKKHKPKLNARKLISYPEHKLVQHKLTKLEVEATSLEKEHTSQHIKSSNEPRRACIKEIHFRQRLQAHPRNTSTTSQSVPAGIQCNDTTTCLAAHHQEIYTTTTTTTTWLGGWLKSDRRRVTSLLGCIVQFHLSTSCMCAPRMSLSSL